MRLPTSYGGVTKLSGNRRNPWRVRVTIGWDIDEKTQKQKQIYKNLGCYPTRQKAMQALAQYHIDPCAFDENTITFAEVYEKWSVKKYEQISHSNENGYRAAYKLCEALYDMKFTDIKLSHLQSVVDKSGKAPPTLKKLKVLLSQMYQYATINDIITPDKDKTEFIYIPQGEKSTKHYRFTNKEIEALWRWAPGNEYVQVILMLIYSGVRPGELFNLKSARVNLDERYFTIDKGKTVNAARKVPIHRSTMPFFEHWMNKGTEYLVTNLSGDRFDFKDAHGVYVNSFFTPLLKDIGINEYVNENGEVKEHLPDDTRHTFTTMWKEKRLDEAIRRKIQGHSGKGIGEIVYTHFELQCMAEELNKL